MFPLADRTIKNNDLVILIFSCPIVNGEGVIFNEEACHPRRCSSFLGTYGSLRCRGNRQSESNLHTLVGNLCCIPLTILMRVLFYRLSASTTADLSSPPWPPQSLSFRCIFNGQASRRPMISSMVTRKDARVKHEF